MTTSEITHDTAGERARFDEALGKVNLRLQAYIDGAYVDAASGETFECVSPITGQVIASVASCDTEDVERAVRGARDAFERGVWSRAAPRDRKAVMIRFSELITHHADELGLIETLDVGKPLANAVGGDIPGAARCIAYYAEAVDKVYDEIAPTAPENIAMVRREPVGVVAAVVPWNFPLLMASWKLGPALATGNSVVLKPAEQSPLTALKIAELAAEAGLPDGVLQVVPGFGETAGRALGLHGDVDMVTFTGSTEVGKLFMSYSGSSNLKRVALECGGKSPHIVMPDCPDLDAAADAVAWGIMYNQGEVCNAGSRLLVHESIREDFLGRVVEIAKTIRPADPLEEGTKLGALVDEIHMKRVLGYIDDGRGEGGELLLGGGRVRESTGGYYVEPTVFDASNEMKISQEEIFGPVLSAITFKNEEEAINIANDSIYGLTAAVWTENINTAHRVAAGIRTGIVWVNTFDSGDMSSPFGGFKQSGFGRDKSLHAMEKYTDLKTTWIRLR